MSTKKTRKKNTAGFEQLEVNLDSLTEEQWLTLYKKVLTEKFDSASVSILNEATVENYKDKIFEVVRNEVVLNIIKHLIKEESKKNANGDPL